VPSKGLYSITENQDAIRRLFAVTRDLTGNLPPMPGIFPDYPAPIVRTGGLDRELTLARCGYAVVAEGADGCCNEAR
jgi:hypothetical protein